MIGLPQPSSITGVAVSSTTVAGSFVGSIAPVCGLSLGRNRRSRGMLLRRVLFAGTAASMFITICVLRTAAEVERGPVLVPVGFISPGLGRPWNPAVPGS